MSVQYKFFRIPVHSMALSEEEMNRFLRSVRVVHVTREFVNLGENSFWAVAVEHMTMNEAATTADSSRKKKRIDYREALSPQDFAVYVKLREWRKKVADEEGVPVYTIFTNEQLAKIVESRVESKTDLSKIEGVGESRLTKYSAAVLELLAENKAESEAGIDQ